MNVASLIVTTTFIGLVVVAAVIYFAATGIGLPLRYEFSAGFRGWAIVQYDRPDCAPLPRRGLYLVLSHDRSGRACTSDSRPQGWRFHTFQYVESGGRRTIPMDRVHSYSVSDWGDSYFIGTKEERAADRTSLSDILRRRR